MTKCMAALFRVWFWKCMKHTCWNHVRQSTCSLQCIFKTWYAPWLYLVLAIYMSKHMFLIFTTCQRRVHYVCVCVCCLVMILWLIFPVLIYIYISRWKIPVHCLWLYVIKHNGRIFLDTCVVFFVNFFDVQVWHIAPKNDSLWDAPFIIICIWSVLEFQACVLEINYRNEELLIFFDFLQRYALHSVCSL